MTSSYQNLFVTKLPRNINDNDLYQVFVEYRPTSAKVMLDATTGKSKGFGFVLFESADLGLKAFENLNHKHVNTHGHGFTLNIFPSKHDGKTASMESNALYIRNIPLTMNKSSVEQFLANFGTMVYCAMREDHYGSPVWVVYVEYDCIDCAKSTLQTLHGSTSYFFDSTAPILAKFADCEEAKRERRKRREDSRNQQTPGCVFPPPSGVAGSTKSKHSRPVPASESSSSVTSSSTSTPVAPAPPRVSMFTPMPLDSTAELKKEGATEKAAGSPRDKLDGSLSMSASHSWSHSSVYRHNPYGGTPTHVRAQEGSGFRQSPPLL